MGDQNVNADFWTVLDGEIAAARAWVAVHPTLALAVAGLVVAVLILALRLRRVSAAAAARIGELEDGFDAQRDARGEAERRLAAEAAVAARVPDLEREVSAARDEAERARAEKADVELRLATLSERHTQTERAAGELRGRLQSAETLVREAADRHESIRTAKAAADEALAARGADLERLGERLADLETRLQAADSLLKQAAARHETLAREKSASDEALAARTTDVRRLGENLADLGRRLAETEAARLALEETRAALTADVARLDETLEQQRRQNAEKLQLLEDARGRMTTEFKVLAEEVMARHGETFTKQNKEQIGTILTPLRDKLTEFQQGLANAQTETTRERATLAEQIRHLAEQSFTMSKETHALTRALKGQSQTQGAWGEMVLARILEQSGLREGEEYVTQESHTHEDGSRLRPDVVINLPEGRRIVIDSKVSLTAFEEHVNAEDEAVRAAALGRHVASLRTHIRGLGDKAYQTVAGSGLDYVMMFVPIEGALAAALTEDPGLTGFAAEKNVAVLTPTTLMTVLKTVAGFWQVDRRNRNAEEIAKRAGLLYEKFAGFVEDLQKVGVRIHESRAAWDRAMGKLSTGNGNLLRQVEQLKSLGARTTKSLPAGLGDDEPAPLLLAAGETDGGAAETDEPATSPDQAAAREPVARFTVVDGG
jgi:DNA recombination protein RmuC